MFDGRATLSKAIQRLQKHIFLSRCLEGHRFMTVRSPRRGRTITSITRYDLLCLDAKLCLTKIICGAVEFRRNNGNNIVQVAQRKNKSVRRVGPCAYGCPTTTSVDISGVCKWQRPPNNMKHLHKLEDVVCQRCYTALAKGTLPAKSKIYSTTGRPPE